VKTSRQRAVANSVLVTGFVFDSIIPADPTM
jgi:hypothetical protein